MMERSRHDREVLSLIISALKRSNKRPWQKRLPQTAPASETDCSRGFCLSDLSIPGLEAALKALRGKFQLLSICTLPISPCTGTGFTTPSISFYVCIQLSELQSTSTYCISFNTPICPMSQYIMP